MKNFEPVALSPLPDLLASRVILALASTEGIDLNALRLPYSARVPSDTPGVGKPRLLDWSGDEHVGLPGFGAAREFFERFELFPGLVVRPWDHPKGRLGFGLERDCVIFELHLPDDGLLISGTPEVVTIAIDGLLPETVCASLVGEPLEKLVAWPPACGPDYSIVEVEADAGIQLVRFHTTPVLVGLSAGAA